MNPEKFFKVSESEQFIFYRVPKMLFDNSCYRNISAEAKLLYGFLLDRMGLSVKNGWCSDDGIVFIYFTVVEASKRLHCGLEKAGRLFIELEKVGLILRKKQGQGKPAKIFIRKFVSEIGKPDVKKSEKQRSRHSVFRGANIPFSDGNNTDRNNTDFNDNNLSICDGMDEIVKQQIEYEILIQKLPQDKEKIDEMVCLIADTLSQTKNTIRISGNDFRSEVVRSRFKKLNNEHIEYVIDTLKKNTTKIHNIRAYLLAALYNAPTTIESYFTAEVNHDLYGA